MKKALFIIMLLVVTHAHVSALVCVDLQSNLTSGASGAQVLELQNFLYSKGYLTAKPNGYFGVGTKSAVKKYQRTMGLSQSGGVLPLTRATIKNETCSSKVVTTNTTTKVIQPTTVASVVTSQATTTSPVVVKKVPLTQNEQRQKDLVDLITAMYAFYKNSNGTFPIPYITTTPVEICTLGISLCNKFNEVKSSLVPNYLAAIPTDPTIATTSVGSLYFIARASDGLITLTAGKTDGKQSIFANCNFYDGCKIKTPANTSTVLGKPYIDSIDRAVFLSGGVMDMPMVIRGKEFSSSSNMVILRPKGGAKTYILDNASSTDGVKLQVSSKFTYLPVSCGYGCSEMLPSGGYDVIVKTTAGESNLGYISIQAITMTSTTNGSDSSFIPKSNHVKLGTVTLSSPSLVTLKSLEFKLNGTTTLVSKISNFTITDAGTGKVTNGGPKFSLGDEKITDYNTKIYELYANIAEIESSYAGRITITGSSTVEEYFSKSKTTVPFPAFLITVSY